MSRETEEPMVHSLRGVCLGLGGSKDDITHTKSPLLNKDFIFRERKGVGEKEISA